MHPLTAALFSAGAHRPAPTPPQRGATRLELVAIVVLIGILIAVALPQLFRGPPSARDARQQVAAALRHAQRSAITLRRNVCVDVGDHQLALTHARAAGATQECAADLRLLNPVNGQPYTDPSNHLNDTLSPSVTLIFDAQGRPLLTPGIPRTTLLSISISGHALPLVVEPETGVIR